MSLSSTWGSLVGRMVKNLPAVPETQVPPLGREGPLEQAAASLPRTLARRIPWTRNLEGTVHAVTKSWTQLATDTQLNITESYSKILSWLECFLSLKTKPASQPQIP